MKRHAGCAPAADVEIVTGADEADRWREQARRLWDAPGMIVRVSWLPAALEQVIALVERIGADPETSIELAGRAGVGAGLVRVEADVAAQVRAVAELREQTGRRRARGRAARGSGGEGTGRRLGSAG